MSKMKQEEIENILVNFQQEVKKIKNLEELEKIRIKYFGRKGIFSSSFKNLINFPLEERKKLGQVLNEIKKKVLEEFMAVEKKLKTSPQVKFDFRHPGFEPILGHQHLITKGIEEIGKIFMNLGFQVADFHEIVSEYENFDSLNIPANHPSRDLWDTLWIASQERKLLRTHTSAHQVEFIKKNKPPFRVIIPGKVFRHEAVDKTHLFQFHQIEGLSIASDANLQTLKGILKYFFSKFFEASIEVSFRTSYFPFVEPGVEVYINCTLCHKKGCSICKFSGYLEIAGAGMIHPFVLKEAGLDYKRNYGYAFGCGLERLIMLKYQIDDIRLFYEADLRFIRQFNEI